MKTDELISLLAGDTRPVRRALPLRRHAAGMALGALTGVAMLVPMLGVNPMLAEDARNAMFWVRLAFVASIALGSLLLLASLSRPGVRLGRRRIWVATPVLVMWMLAVAVLLTANPALRAELVLGQTWRLCPFNIALLSLPTFVALLWLMKGLAPTRLRLAGAIAGLLAGATGALVYTLHCPELAAPFLAVWYVIGMSIPTAAGALLGPRLLRW